MTINEPWLEVLTLLEPHILPSDWAVLKTDLKDRLSSNSYATPDTLSYFFTEDFHNAVSILFTP